MEELTEDEIAKAIQKALDKKNKKNRPKIVNCERKAGTTLNPGDIVFPVVYDKDFGNEFLEVLNAWSSRFIKEDGTIVDLNSAKFGRSYHKKINIVGKFQLEKIDKEVKLTVFCEEKSPMIYDIFKDNGIKFNTTFSSSGLHIMYRGGEISVTHIDTKDKSDSKYGANTSIMVVKIPSEIEDMELSKLIEQLANLLIISKLDQLDIEGYIGDGSSEKNKVVNYGGKPLPKEDKEENCE